jgi:hypothetical protein
VPTLRPTPRPDQITPVLAVPTVTPTAIPADTVVSADESE